MDEKRENLHTQLQTASWNPLTEGEFETEDLLQQLIGQHPELLAGEQIRPGRPPALDSHPGVRCRLRVGQLTYLLIDQQARPTLVEVKRGSNREIRRTIVGQMLDYAATAAGVWSERDMRRIFEESSDNPDDEIGNLLGDDNEPDIDAFWEQLATNLDANRLRLLFVADEIPNELERVVKFLNEQTRDNLEVLAVEVKRYPGRSTQTLVSRVIGQTNTRAPLNNARNGCLCGCARGTNGRFYPGDDSKLKSWLANAENGKVLSSDGNLNYAAERCRNDPTLFCAEFKSGDIIRLAKVQEEYRMRV